LRIKKSGTGGEVARSNELQIGDRIPIFTLPDKNGTLFNITDILGKKNLVLYFYPKDETPGCTAEACNFRDSYEDFLNHDCEVIGISADSSEQHLAFAGYHRLPFILLSDEGNQVRDLFGVPKSYLGLLPGRVTYVIDKQGIIRHIFNSQFQIKKHILKALTVLKKL
jgi:peroxiredoxin Q/BCP